MKVIWNGHTVAESSETVFIEGNYYFPPESLNRAFVQDSELTTECFWKGTAHYYHLDDGTSHDANALWYYPEPKAGSEEKVKHTFRNYVAFYKDKVVFENQ